MIERCKNCLTPVSYPGIKFNEDGVCNHCTEYYEAYKDWDSKAAERRRYFEETLEKVKRKNKKFDVLVPLSGGKDSTYILYLAAKVYNLKVLCYNFDNGLQSQIAKDNIKNAIDATGAELFTYKPDKELLIKLYKHFLIHTGMFCPVCMRGIYAGTHLAAQKYDVPLVFNGTSVRTEERLVPEIFQDGRLSFFKNVLKKHPVPYDLHGMDTDRSFIDKIKRAIFLLSKERINLGRIEIQVPDYVEWNYDEIFDVIINKMGWNDEALGMEHIDCLAHPVVHHFIRGTRLPDLTESTLRFSAEIRAGQRDRGEALKIVEKEIEERKVPPKETTFFTEILGITENELYRHMEDGFRHMQFQKEGLLIRLFNFLRGQSS